MADSVEMGGRRVGCIDRAHQCMGFIKNRIRNGWKLHYRIAAHRNKNVRKRNAKSAYEKQPRGKTYVKETQKSIS